MTTPSTRGPSRGIAHEKAVALLVEEGIERADAVDDLAQLQHRCYVYVVNDMRYVTDRGELE